MGLVMGLALTLGDSGWVLFGFAPFRGVGLSEYGREIVVGFYVMMR